MFFYILFFIFFIFFFFFNDTATTEIYTVMNTLSLHDALPIPGRLPPPATAPRPRACPSARSARRSEEHTSELQSLITTSYAVFCLKKKKPDGRDQRSSLSSDRRSCAAARMLLY